MKTSNIGPCKNKTGGKKPISSQTQILLNHVYQGCQMGMTSVHRLVEKSSSDQTKELLLNLAHEHRRIMDKAAEEMRPYKTAPADLGAGARLRVRMVAMQVCPRNPEKRISKTLILGSRMALHSLMRYLRQNPYATGKSQHLVGELISLEKRTMREGLRMAKRAE